MTIKSFPYGIPFSSSHALTASYALTASVISTQTASLADFITGFVGPSGSTGSTLDNNGQFTTVPSYNIQFIGSAHNPSGSPTFPSHQTGDFIILYGETTASSAPLLSAGTGWVVVSSTSSPSTIFATKIASSSAETFPSFAARPPINNAVVVYRNVDNINIGGSVSCNNCSTMQFGATSPTDFTDNRNHWIMILQRATNVVNSLTPAEVPRGGFVNRLIGYSGSLATPNSRLYAIHDSNAVTGSISGGGTVSVNASTSYTSVAFTLRAKLNYSQFES